jgi:hypothetical protein
MFVSERPDRRRNASRLPICRIMHTSTRTRSLTALLALVGGCASTPRAAPDTNPAVLIDQSGRVYRTTDSPTAASFATPPDSTFRALVAAYNTLGIEPTLVDPSGRVVARQHLVLRSTFRGKPLSSAFDCGNGQTGPRADQGRITVDVSSRVTSAGSGSAMSTTIDASLVPNDGVSRDPIRCVSHGGIEESLRKEVSMQLGLSTTTQ